MISKVFRILNTVRPIRIGYPEDNSQLATGLARVCGDRRMIKMVITLKRREGMSLQEFKDYRRDVHAPLLFSIPEANRYIKRFVVSYAVPAPNFPEPTYDAVVEAWFDTMDDLEALYLSRNFQTKVDPDHPNFIDMSKVGRIVSEEIVVVA